MTRKFLALCAASSLFALQGCIASTSLASAPDDSAANTAQIDTEAPRPNVLLILFDDMGYGQLGITGHEIIKTPNIDALAREGMIFANGYAGSTVCSPSRISLMMGRDTSRLHSSANTISLRAGDRTMAHLLSDAGYQTALFGKFGIGTTFGETDPMAMGFQQWKGLLHNIQAHRQFPMFMFENNQMVPVPENRAGAREGYAQRLFTDDALEFLDTQDGSTPFFAFVSYTSPHSEMAAPEEFVAPYRGKFPETPYNGLAGPTPASQFPDYYPLAIDEPNAVQAGMIAALDSYVGELVAKLEARGLRENTLIIITSDNGPHSEGGGDPIGIAAAGPFRGGKRDLTEGGIHMPFIASWPSVVQAGRVEDQPVMFADLMPTLGALAGKPGAAEAMGANGVSLAQLLMHEEATLPDRMLYWAFSRQLGDPNSGVIGVTQQAGRIGKWKALRASEDAAVELYDLSTDPGESKDVARQYPDIAADFANRFDEELEEQARYTE
ncbi:sulfatase-like hydrolase/transferase [Altererythrobacter ishigakiensis]|uniref:Arylsulfatase A-like enzyme n=1 Tax=Altererythrobacter ishigakiensis TaxID=476157 RepID=A0A562UM34_9SPHN|nr:sulfatase-like hydrolase/transferase [Altererythrobacter ishigakiensis]TWJ06672.1 arylsulfatase A-like enzyme [Altererythrobacter ishigakiensis]